MHPDIQKTAGDLIVPFERLAESLALYREVFSVGLDYAIWGHVSDGNLHPNVVPRSFDDVQRGREAILEMARGVFAGWAGPRWRSTASAGARSSSSCYGSSTANADRGDARGQTRARS